MFWAVLRLRPFVSIDSLSAVLAGRVEPGVKVDCLGTYRDLGERKTGLLKGGSLPLGDTEAVKGAYLTVWFNLSTQNLVLL